MLIDYVSIPAAPYPTQDTPSLSLAALTWRKQRYGKGLIPPPKYYQHARIHVIQEAMGISPGKFGKLYNDIVPLFSLHLNLTKPLNEQNKAKLKLLEQEAVSIHSILGQYKNAWPLKWFIKRFMKHRVQRVRSRSRKELRKVWAAITADEVHDVDENESELRLIRGDPCNTNTKSADFLQSLTPNLTRLLPVFIEIGLGAEEDWQAFLSWTFDEKVEFFKNVFDDKRLTLFEFETLKRGLKQRDDLD